MEEKGLLLTFQHRFFFFVPNFSRIVSIKMENFLASYANRSNHKQSFVWGSYDLFVHYQKYTQKKEISRCKVFTSNFSYVIATPPESSNEDDGHLKKRLVCEAGYSSSINPLAFSFFPLLSKIKYTPFKIDVLVNGNIYQLPLPTDNREAQKGEAQGVAKKEKMIPSIPLEAAKKEKSFFSAPESEQVYFSPENVQRGVPLKTEQLAEKVTTSPPQRISLQAQKEQQKSPAEGPDLIALQSKKKHSSVPLPDENYYKTYRFFYEQMLKNQPKAGVQRKQKK